MKKILVEKETKRIERILNEEENLSLQGLEGIEEVSITNKQAEKVKNAKEPLFFIDKVVYNFEEKLQIQKKLRQQQRFEQNENLIKSSKKIQIKQNRDKEYKSNIVTSDGLEFKTDLETITDLKTIIGMLADGEVFVDYKLADGTYATITKEQLLQKKKP
jgi:predicted flavoprotein YhiN